MLNQVVLVGRLVRHPELHYTKTGKRLMYLPLAVNRTYKSTQTGNYETDFITVTLWENLAEHVANYCKKGSIIGFKGRLAMNNFETEDGEYKERLDIIGEKVSFISHPKHSKDIEEDDAFEA